MNSSETKLKLLALLYDARNALPHEKANAMAALDAEVDRVRAGTSYSRSQVKEMLLKDGFREYAKRRKIQEHSGF